LSIGKFQEVRAEGTGRKERKKERKREGGEMEGRKEFEKFLDALSQKISKGNVRTKGKEEKISSYACSAGERREEGKKFFVQNVGERGGRECIGYRAGEGITFPFKDSREGRAERRASL